MDLRLGNKVKFQKELDRYTRNTKESIVFFRKHHEKSFKWGIISNPNIEEGIICGIRYMGEGRKIKAYLVANAMNKFHRVPEEFIISEAGV